MEIAGQPAIVTGGASGLGAATARELAAHGAKVAIFDRNAELGKSIADEIGGMFFDVDVSDEESVKMGLASAASGHGSARMLVNCAGIGPAWKTASRSAGVHPLEGFMKVIAVNLVGTFNCARLAADAMLGLEPLDEGGERGVIVNTASGAAFEGQIGQVAYAASKGAVVSMTLPMARDLANDGIRCATIAPGLFETPMVGTLPEKVRDHIIQSIPFPRRMGEASEFASLVREICRNQMINGSTYRLDAAVRAQPR